MNLEYPREHSESWTRISKKYLSLSDYASYTCDQTFAMENSSHTCLTVKQLLSNTLT
jgi:hypothetical protein